MLLKIVRSFYLLIFISVLFPACDFLDNLKRNAVITIGNRKITDQELKRDIRRITMEMGISDQEVSQELDLLVNKVIDKYVIMEYGQAKGITLSESELESAIMEIKKGYPENVFNELLIKKYIEYGEWKEIIREDLLIRKIINNAMNDITPVSFDEIKSYFETHQKEFLVNEMVRFRQIVTKTKDEAEEVLKLLSEGKDMGELARERSIAPEAKENGLVGWIEKGDLEEPMEKALFSLAIGRYSGVLETNYGYHVLEVLEKRGAGMRNLPESIAAIEEKLLAEKKDTYFREWLKNLRGQIKIEVKQDIYKNWSLDR